MAEIEIVTKYKLDGVEYASTDKLKSHVENELGALIDKMSQSMATPLTTKQRLELFAGLVANKDQLKWLLSIDLPKSDNWDNNEFTNILDY